MEPQRGAPVVWWIRRDLRLSDNQALDAALRHARATGAAVLPVFVLDPALLASDWAGEKRRAFLFDGLRALDGSLRERGSRLVVRSGEPAAALQRLRAETGAAALYAERDHSPYAGARDARVGHSLPLTLVDGVTACAPGAVLTEGGTPYTVFTPFSKRWRAAACAGEDLPLSPPDHVGTLHGIESEGIPESARGSERSSFPAGEAEAGRRLAAFVDGDDAPIFRYAETRNRPDWEGTSGLSPYLRFGMVSARTTAHAAWTAIERAPGAGARRSAEAWLNELIWREFYVSILHHFPQVRGSAFRPAFDRIEWLEDQDGFDAWREGRTGYPIVDAAMRQLAATGWMHNRCRMIVASFLVKDLLIDWRWGERWFMQQLVDGDPAANNGGWQWSAGTGTDAAPYFRIFSPVSQGEKFDPEGAFVRRWVPELQHVPAQWIHSPWTLPLAEQARAGCRIGKEYPQPVVDHKFARERVLAAYAAART